MLDLTNAHRRFIPIILHQIIRVVQGSSHPRHNLHPCFLRQLLDLLIPASGIRIGILFEDKMGNFPAFEDFGKNGLRRLSYDKELTFLVELRNSIGQVLLTFQPVIIVKLARVSCGRVTPVN